MLCFDLWLSTGERGYLEASIRYNDDDCRATKVVKEWLVEAVDEAAFRSGDRQVLSRSAANGVHQRKRDSRLAEKRLPKDSTNGCQFRPAVQRSLAEPIVPPAPHAPTAMACSETGSSPPLSRHWRDHR